MNNVDLFFAAAQVGSTAVTVAVVFGPGLAAAAAGAGCRAILRAHYRRRDNRATATALAQQVRIDNIRLQYAQETAVRDDEPGLNLDLRDQCELLYNQPARTDGNQ